ncbi:uncharacterized protein LOC112175396 [Rosa chinensis]|uniref:uncharacterized protein LOC112175396 n=1 Tax=Rosa chinensis TaxID=74649 RepID=UPI000D08E95C|nr:uncharacterized protein LOC112175396 [Rosa chinensis]
MSLTTVEDVGGVATGQALSADGNNDNEETRGRSTKRAAVIGSSNVEFTCGKDYTSEFTTTRIFKSRDDLVEWACEVGRLNGFKIITFRSENGKGNKRARITLACERSGKYDRRTSKRGKNRRPQGTIKCDCPFKLQGKKLETDDDWELKVVKGIHNHSAWYSNADLLFSSRFPSDGKSRENDELKDDIQQPMEILQEDNDPSAPPLPEIVSDGKSRGKDELKDDIQQLLEILQEDNDPFASPLPEIVEFAQCSSVGSPIVH